MGSDQGQPPKKSKKSSDGAAKESFQEAAEASPKLRPGTLPAYLHEQTGLSIFTPLPKEPIPPRPPEEDLIQPPFKFSSQVTTFTYQDHVRVEYEGDPSNPHPMASGYVHIDQSNSSPHMLRFSPLKRFYKDGSRLYYQNDSRPKINEDPQGRIVLSNFPTGMPSNTSIPMSGGREVTAIGDRTEIRVPHPDAKTPVDRIATHHRWTGNLVVELDRKQVDTLIEKKEISEDPLLNLQNVHLKDGQTMVGLRGTFNTFFHPPSANGRYEKPPSTPRMEHDFDARIAQMTPSVLDRGLYIVQRPDGSVGLRHTSWDRRSWEASLKKEKQERQRVMEEEGGVGSWGAQIS